MRFLLTLGLLFLAPAYALGGQQVPKRDRVLIGGLAGIATATPTLWDCCAGVREAPDIVPWPDQAVPTVLGVDARYLWTRQTGTFVQWWRSTTSTQSFTYPRPAAPTPPFTNYGAERHVSSRHHQWLFGQTFEMSSAARVKTWFFGAFGVRMTDEQQESIALGFNDPAVRLVAEDAWRMKQVQLFVGVGSRVNAGPGLFVGGEVGIGLPIWQGCPDCHQRIDVQTGDGQATMILRALAGVRF